MRWYRKRKNFVEEKKDRHSLKNKWKAGTDHKHKRVRFNLPQNSRYFSSSDSDEMSFEYESDSDSDTHNSDDESSWDTSDSEDNATPHLSSSSRNDSRTNQNSRGSNTQVRRRVGRRGRQKARKRSQQQVNHDDSWYFPNERQDEHILDERITAEIVAENEDWIRTIQSQQNSAVSPLAQGTRDHTVTWYNNAGRAFLPPNQIENGRIRTNEAALLDHDPDTESFDQQERPVTGFMHPRILPRMSDRQQQRERIPVSSNIDMNFNLAQQLIERNRVIQQISQQASHIQSAAAAFQQMIQNATDIVQQQSEQHYHNMASNHSLSRFPHNQRSAGNAQDHENGSSYQHLSQENMRILPSSTEMLLSDSNLYSQNQREPSTRASLPDENPFSRYDEAYRRQEERNRWRSRRRQRQNRRERRQRAGMRLNRQRPEAQRSNSSLSNEESETHLVPNRSTPPTPPPLPSVNWIAPPRIRNENHGFQENNSFSQLPHNPRNSGNRLVNDSGYNSAAESMVLDNEEQEDIFLRNYQDPAESNSPLGEFLRSSTDRSRVIISRVRRRITKQYFKRGDFQIALADFRSVYPENSRQVAGVGYTGTVNNMYRLTVKKNSSFGKPTFEIRPMNKRVRRKKVHVCYKIRYIPPDRRKTNQPSRIPIPA